MTDWTPERLVAFEQRVADAFAAGRIRAPVHLSGGNEGQLVEVFKDVRRQDWVFSTWRSHHHALLKGIPEQWVWDEVAAGRSMYLMSKEHRFFCSAIVGGALPVAAGVAMGMKRRQDDFQRKWQIEDFQDRVFVFVGDMAARTGLFHEFRQFCAGHRLPVRIVVEDNGLSTDTPTEEAWGTGAEPVTEWRYRYARTWPHVGIGQRVSF